jgi:hypothetical protein
MTGRRSFVTTLAACLVAGAVVVIAAGRVWGRAALTTVTGSVDRVSVTGHDAEPALPALGIALLVLAVGLIAARGWLRRLVGLIVVVVGAAVLALAVASRSDVAQALARGSFAVSHSTVPSHTSGWAVVSAIAGLVAVGCGALTVAVGARWGGVGWGFVGAGGGGVGRDGEACATAVWVAVVRGVDPWV